MLFVVIYYAVLPIIITPPYRLIIDYCAIIEQVRVCVPITIYYNLTSDDYSPQFGQGI